ncbi:MAG: hypothetical protein R3250_01835 [Melioribacteraceae bacterium]|nr:hypothetical protein [Melioribacteraceae bacterium]
MKVLLLTLAALILLIPGCSTSKIVNSKQINLFSKDASTWTLEQCHNVIDFYSVDNSGGDIYQAKLMRQKVYIRALLLNVNSLKALSRKEVIEKRLENQDYYDILNNYLDEFLKIGYDKSSDKIIDANENFSWGFTFKVYFENISDPYEPIFLADGYSYFFLENLEGEFSRVKEVSGLYVEDYFELDGYLNATITFSPFSAGGKRLYENKVLNESYRLVFNGLQRGPIILRWNLNQ